MLYKGKMHFAINSKAGIVLQAPAVFWHHHSRSYQYGPVNREPYHLCWIMLQGPRAERLILEGFDQLSPRGYIPVKDANLFHAMISQLILKINQNNPLLQAECVVGVERFLHALCREVTAFDKGSKQSSSLILNNLMNRMSAGPGYSWTISAMSKECNLSESRFRALFKKTAGLPP